jgi:hypothetical protein
MRMDPIQLSGFQQIDFLSLKPELLYTGRRDTKYLMHYHDWIDVVSALENSYCVVLHYGKTSQTYSTVYYDTPDLNFYMAHHNGHGNRMKIRTRTYSDGYSFFEVKQKTNKGLTIKERYNEPVDHIDGLIPQLETIYDRVTMYDKNFEEKLTFDFKLSFRNDTAEIGFNSIVIAESKKMKNTHSAFVDELKNKKIASNAVSKYCIGMASLYPSIKKNNFKTLLHKINKLNNKYELASNY